MWADFSSYGYELPVIEFYGHTKGHHRAFSNFYEHAAFTFTVPECCGRAELEASGRPSSVAVTFTEKAIMLCKASVMGDYETYDAIMRAPDPRTTKALGRSVHPWRQQLWESVVCEVGRECVTQKFTLVPGLSNMLLKTGNQLIAEMTRNDANWGTGLDVGHADANSPGRWRGTNILGWSLMMARESLRGDAAQEPIAIKRQKTMEEADESDEPAAQDDVLDGGEEAASTSVEPKAKWKGKAKAARPIKHADVSDAY